MNPIMTYDSGLNEVNGQTYTPEEFKALPVVDRYIDIGLFRNFYC